MAKIRLNEVKFPQSEVSLEKAKKGEGWIRKVYKELYFKACKRCNEPFLGSKQICSKCEEEIAEELRWVECSCGEKFRLEDNQNRQTRVCPACKEEDYEFYCNRILNFFEKPYYSRSKDKEERMYKFASKARNDVQSVTGYSNFKMHYHFENVDWKVDNTWEHINSMTFLTYNLLKTLYNDSSKRTKEYITDYLLHFGVQFRTSANQNQSLIQYQSKPEGITPREYISIVGSIKGKSVEETVSIIKKHFINKGDD
jgi:hypothetical protein